MAYPGASSNTARFGPAMSGGGALPVTVNSASPLAPGEPTSSLPTDAANPSAVASGPVGSVNPASGVADNSAKPSAGMPPYGAKTAGADDDVDPATGKKRSNGMSMA